MLCLYVQICQYSKTTSLVQLIYFNLTIDLGTIALTNVSHHQHIIKHGTKIIY